MALKVSTGLRDHMLASGSFKNAMDSGFLRLYSGTEPATADAAVAPAVLQCTISDAGAGGGLTWEAVAVSGVLSKPVSQAWQGAVSPGGTVTFFRFVATGDDGLLSTSQRRIQGTIDIVGGDLNLSNTLLVNLSIQTINHFNVALPTL